MTSQPRSESPTPLIKKILHFLSYWQDALIWLPIALAIMLTSWTWSLALDSQAAPVDAGAVQLLAFNALCLVLIAFFGWLLKKLYFGENAEEEAAAARQLTPLQRVILETVQWFALFGFVAFVLLRGL